MDTIPQLGKGRFRSPIEVIGMAALACNSVFGLAAAHLNDPVSFKYCIHMFLGILAVLLLTAIWSPASLYHPGDLGGIPKESQPKYRPWVPTACMFLAMIIYMAYQYIMARSGL